MQWVFETMEEKTAQLNTNEKLISDLKKQIKVLQAENKQIAVDLNNCQIILNNQKYLNQGDGK